MIRDSSDSDSRRSFLKKGALASGALALGLGGAGGVAAQDDQEGDGTDGEKALMFNDEFRPGSQFRVTSPVIQQDPHIDAVQKNPDDEVQPNDVWTKYNTRIIEYLNTSEEVYLFPTHESEIQQGGVYEFQPDFTRFTDAGVGEGLITVVSEPVPEDEARIPGDDNQLEPGDDFEVVEGGGKALVRANHLFPGGLIRITSDVVEWTPREDVRGSDPFSDYNTRHAEYLNVNDEFLLYPAHDAQIDRDGVYVIRDEFDITDPEGNLTTVDLDRVNEDDLDDGLL